jgi:hypothetical protein
MLVLLLLEQLEPEHVQDYFACNDYLNSAVLEAAANAELVQLQALQQVLAWLLQLPAGQARGTAVDMIRQNDGWLQLLLKCWAAEVQQTGCGVQQAAAAAAERYAAAYGGAGMAGAVPAASSGPGCSTLSAAAAAAAGSGGSSRGVGRYLAGLCQLLLQLLGVCCCQDVQSCSAAAGETQAAVSGSAVTTDQQQQLGQQVDLQKLALQLLAGNAALLLHWPVDRPQQERCTYAGLWRNCLRVNAQARSGSSSSSSRVGLQAAVQQLLARMPAGAVGLSSATPGVS